jgi:TRAP-type C4-dicarboxylate transport system substrate-binding protein
MRSDISVRGSSGQLPRRRALATAAAAILGAPLLATPHVARAATRVLRCGHGNPDSSHFGQAGVVFAAAVAAHPDLAGRFAIEMHGHNEIGDDQHLLKDLVDGTGELMISGCSVIGDLVPTLGVMDAPYLFRDVATARAVLDGPLGREFSALAEAKNISVLAWAENGLRHITSNRPIRQPSDLKDFKLRVPPTAVMRDGMQALGADARPYSFALVPEALRTGQFDGQEYAIITIESAKLSLVQSHVNLTGHIYDPGMILASGDLMADFTPVQREAMRACAALGSAKMREVAAAAQDQGIKRLAAAGMTVVSDVNVAAFRAAARPYLETLRSGSDRELIQRLIEAAA